jgi:hypothetical protein
MKEQGNPQEQGLYKFSITGDQHARKAPVLSSDLVRSRELSDRISREEAQEIAKDFAIEIDAGVILNGISNQGIVLQEFLTTIKEKCYIPQSIKDWNRVIPNITIISPTGAEPFLKKIETIYDLKGKVVTDLDGKNIVATLEEAEKDPKYLISVEQSIKLLEEKGVQNAPQIVAERMQQKIIYDSQGQEAINLNRKKIVATKEETKKDSEHLIDFERIVEALSERGVENADLIIHYFGQNVLNGISLDSAEKLFPPQVKVIPWRGSDIEEINIILDSNNKVIGFDILQAYRIREELEFDFNKTKETFSQHQIQENQILCQTEIRLNPDMHKGQLGSSEIVSMKTTFSSQGEIGKKVVRGMEHILSKKIDVDFIDIFGDRALIEEYNFQFYQGDHSLEKSTDELLEKAKEKQAQLIRRAGQLDIDENKVQEIINRPSLKKRNDLEKEIELKAQVVGKGLNMAAKEVLTFLDKGEMKDLVYARKLNIEVNDLLKQDRNSLKSAIHDKAQEAGKRFNMSPNEMLKFLEKDGEIKDLEKRPTYILVNFFNKILRFFSNIIMSMAEKIMPFVEKKDNKTLPSEPTAKIDPPPTQRINKKHSQDNDRQL